MVHWVGGGIATLSGGGQGGPREGHIRAIRAQDEPKSRENIGVHWGGGALHIWATPYRESFGDIPENPYLKNKKPYFKKKKTLLKVI